MVVRAAAVVDTNGRRLLAHASAKTMRPSRGLVKIVVQPGRCPQKRKNAQMRTAASVASLRARAGCYAYWVIRLGSVS